MAKKRSLWAELQRERANRLRLEQQALRAVEREQAKAERDREQARRAAARQAAANERERKRLYIEDRKAEAAAMRADLQARIAQLDAVLTAGVNQGPGVSFDSLKHSVDMPPFDAGRLGQADHRAAVGAVRSPASGRGGPDVRGQRTLRARGSCGT